MIIYDYILNDYINDECIGVLTLEYTNNYTIKQT